MKQFAADFKVKIEMRQIGIRQEAAKVGGIGAVVANYAVVLGSMISNGVHMQSISKFKDQSKQNFLDNVVDSNVVSITSWIPIWMPFSISKCRKNKNDTRCCLPSKA